MSYSLKAGEIPSIDLMSVKEKFDLLPPTRRKEIIEKLSDEEASRMTYDWDFNGRSKQLPPDNPKSRATSYCMCRYLAAQANTDKRLRLENFPACEPMEKTETSISYDEPTEDGWKKVPFLNYWIKEITHEEPKVCHYRSNWQMWVLLAGRGFGKSRVGAEWVRHMVETGQAKRIAIIIPTAADGRDVCTEGESGILNIAPAWNKPLYESTKRRISWNNGAIATLFSAEEPERLRGPQFDAAWIDEIAGFDLNTQQTTFDMLNFCLRLFL